MKCMCAQTRPRFILSSERVFGGLEFEPMLTPREKAPLPENVPRGGSNPQRCGQLAQALPTELFRLPDGDNENKDINLPVTQATYIVHNAHYDCYNGNNYDSGGDDEDDNGGNDGDNENDDGHIAVS